MNTGGVHGSALGADEVAATKKILGFDPDKSFEVRDDVIAHTRELVDRGKKAHADWQVAFDAWAEREPERKELLDRLQAQKLPEGWDADLPHWELDSKPVATRAASGAGAGRRRPDAARTVGWFGRPGRQQQHHHQGRELVWAAVDLDRGLERDLVRPHAALRHPRARDGRDPVRHRAARPDAAPTAERSCSSRITCGRPCVWLH